MYRIDDDNNFKWASSICLLHGVIRQNNYAECLGALRGFISCN